MSSTSLFSTPYAKKHFVFKFHKLGVERDLEGHLAQWVSRWRALWRHTPATTTYAPGGKELSHTHTHPDSHRFRELLLSERIGLYFSGVLGEKTENRWPSLTLPFTREKTESQIHQMTCPGLLKQLFIWRQNNSPENLCPPTHITPSQL